MRLAIQIVIFLLNLFFPSNSFGINKVELIESKKEVIWNKVNRYTKSTGLANKNKNICKRYIDHLTDYNKPNLVDDFKKSKLYLDCSFDLIKFKDNSIYILFSKLLKKGHNKIVYNAIDIKNPNRNLVALVAKTSVGAEARKNLREHQISSQFSYYESILKPYNFDYFPYHHPSAAVISIYDKFETTLQKFANKTSHRLTERWAMIKPIIEDFTQLQNSLIHRDIKFGNIVCKKIALYPNLHSGKKYACALIDFEFSLLKEEWEENKRVTQMLGTTVNLAPELYNRYSLSKHFWSHLIKRESFSFGMVLLALFGFKAEYDECLSFLKKMYSIQKSREFIDRQKQSKNREVLDQFMKWHSNTYKKSIKMPFSSLRRILLDMVNPIYIHRPELSLSKNKIDDLLHQNPHITTEH